MVKPSSRFYLLLFFSIVLIFASEFLQRRNKKTKCVYRVLSYSSFVGPKSVGESLKNKFENENDCDLDLINGGSSAQLLSKARMYQGFYDAVLGVHEIPEQYKDFFMFSYSPMVVLRKGRGSKEIIVPNPNYSYVGESFENFDTVCSYEVKRVSSWTAGLGLFNQKEATNFYTFAGSLYYFLKEKASNNYQLGESGVGMYREYVIYLKNKSLNSQFEKALYSVEIQKDLWNKNYMFPVNTKAVPETLVEFKKDFKSRRVSLKRRGGQCE